MSPILLGLLIHAAPCFVATDATPGWKHVTLPFDAYGLAAPDGVDQFRSNESVTLVEDHSSVYLTGWNDGAGVTAFEFQLGDGGKSVDIEFTEPLQGAKVDVTARGQLGWMSLMREQRQAGSRLTLTWGDNSVQTVKVRVHHHLRRDPVLAGWHSVRRVPSARMSMSDAFRLERSLYYRQPPGPAVVLCHDPGRELTLRPEEVELFKERPVPVLLKKL